MQYKLRDGSLVGKETREDKAFHFLYHSRFGSIILKLLTARPISKTGGLFLSTPLSTLLIDPFIKCNNISLKDCIPCKYGSYNAFFTRRLRPERRPIDEVPEHFISPCDGKMSFFPITENRTFYIKNSVYTLSSLLQSKELAKTYTGGTAVLLRLSVDNYHRYCYIDEARKGINHFISGCLHTVNPIATSKVSVYAKNSRSYCLLMTKNFGTVLHMEVGALMVGKIKNHHEKKKVFRGMEKGFFEFGGSSILLLIKPGVLTIDDDIQRNMESGYETLVHMGEQIGCRSDKVE